MESIPGLDGAFPIFSPECTNYPELRVRAGVRRLVGPPRCPRGRPRLSGAGRQVEPSRDAHREGEREGPVAVVVMGGGASAGGPCGVCEAAG